MNKTINTDILELMFTVSRAMKDKMSYESEFINLTYIQMRTLLLIHSKSSSIQMKDIAEHFSIEMPTATSLVNKLYKLDMIERIPDSNDRRIVRIVLSKKGAALLEKIITKHKQRLGKMLSYLTDKQKV